MFETLKNAKSKVVGLKQVLRELTAENIVCVYLADDADEHLKEKIKEAIGSSNISIVEVSSMDELGSVCDIEVSAACAGILK